MAKRNLLAVALASVFGAAAAGEAPVVLVTGATGRTGILLYNLLKQQGASVRAFVRNATKARDVLHCDKCDESEGIYVGDLTDSASIDRAVQGTTTLAVASSAVPVCPPPLDIKTCYYNKGGYPVDIDFHAGKAQLQSFAAATSGKGHVVFCSASGTTKPDSYLDKLGNGFISFYKLNEEAALMSYGLPHTIVKPCGLMDTPGGKATLLVGHDDELKVSPPMVARADVARVMAEAVLQPERATDLRFDLCSQSGTATEDIGQLFDAARFPWHKAVEPQLVV